MPPKPRDYQTRAEYEAAVRQYRRAMFPQTLPDKTPEQMKIDRVYGEDFVAPYDDDGMFGQEPKKKSAMQGMRFIKENQNGTGKADTKGLIALGRSGAKGREAYKNITGKEFKEPKEAGMGMKYRMGTGMADEKMMEYGRKMMEHSRKLMEHGEKAKVYQGGTGDMEAAVAEVKKQNPDATTEEITNFLLNPEAGFQKGDIGRLGGTSGRPEQLPTFQDFFEKEYGYFPTVGTLPTTGQGAYRGSDLKGAPENVFYSDLTEKTSDDGLFRGSVDRGSGAFPTAGGRYETVEDFRDYQPGSSFQGVRFFKSGAGDEELRGAYKTKKDVDEANKRYAEMMRKARVSQPRTAQYEAIDPKREGESGGFRVTGPQSQVQKTMGEKLMRAGMYIR